MSIQKLTIMTLVTCATRDNNKRIIEIAEKNIIT